MGRFKHLIMVCTNQRDASDPRGSCTGRGSAAILERLKQLTHERKLKGQVRVTSCGCLDLCSKGCAAVVFSDDPNLGETWYTRLTLADADLLFENHVQKGKRLEQRVECHYSSTTS